MIETKFTPGPWERDGDDVMATESYGFVASLIELEADGDLIATAPDLYARVAAHADQCGACSGTGTPNRMSAMDDSRAADGSCSVCYEDRRVMAKARGE